MNARHEAPNWKPKIKSIEFVRKDRVRMSSDKIDDSLDMVFGETEHFRHYPHCMKKGA